MIATVELVQLTCWCGMPHAVPEKLRASQLRAHRDGREITAIYCPLGHQHVPSGEGEAARLQKELKLAQDRLVRERQQHDQTKAAKETTERQLVATKGVVTKMKKRVGNGVCPCCHRTFKQLSRHMENKHPEFAESGEK